ncbi:UBX domain-containing protein 11 [Phlyctochytrium planicorne]|nr:UBX domain-containing protein 11 [Phlyctochytrium planicorne]
MEKVEEEKKNKNSVVLTALRKITLLEKRVNALEKLLRDLDIKDVPASDPHHGRNSEFTCVNNSSSSPLTSTQTSRSTTASHKSGFSASNIYRLPHTPPLPPISSATLTNILPCFPYDFSLLISQIRDLNSLAGDGISKVVSGTGGGTLERPQCLSLKMYSNGMVVGNGRFRTFAERSAKAFMEDILDGYFPYELKERYPDGDA